MNDTPRPSHLDRLRERLPHYWRLIRGDRPIGTLLLLWPTWWALWLASGGWPAWQTWLIFTLGVWLTRSAGCVINDYADRWLDPQVERTRYRPPATGAVPGREASHALSRASPRGRAAMMPLMEQCVPQMPRCLRRAAMV